MDDLLREFVTETTESLAQLDVELVRLEQMPNDPALLRSVFRMFHTIKGTCGFVNLPRLERVAHAAENVLGRIRDGQMAASPEAAAAALESIDRIKSILKALERDGREPAGDDAALIGKLDALADGTAPPPAAPAMAMPSVEAGNEGSLSDQSIRVSVDLLETLMTMVSELVLTRNQLLQILRGRQDSEFAVPLHRLSQVTTGLQEGVMKARMQPIGSAWSKLRRLVRDLSVELGKKIEIRMHGADTELDRQVLQLIRDPLTHMVRNASDHGIEAPEERVQVGKPDVGTISLSAHHEAGYVVIQLADDGRGFDIARIRAKALALGLAAEAEIEAMSDAQVCQFIFRPGFTTAAEVTALSGRGVGMDVVRTNIEKIGGAIELRSQRGRGTTFVLKIPLTLAIAAALIVECSGERYAIPQTSVLEVVRAVPGTACVIERIDRARVMRLRDRPLPVVALDEVLNLNGTAPTRDEGHVVVAQVGATVFGVLVDRVFDTQEIVVKPVSPVLRHIGVFSGNTILGDGSVVLILDPSGIAWTLGEGEGAETPETAPARVAAEAAETPPAAMLLFRAGAGGPKAVPLALAARLEKFDREAIEMSDGRPVVQYRGRLMPLVPVDTEFQPAATGSQPVLVLTEGNRRLGLMVDEILDIVEEPLEVQIAGNRPGLRGTAIVAGKSTDVIDAEHYLALAAGDWYRGKAAAPAEAAKGAA